MSGDVVFAHPQVSFALPEIKAGFPPLLALAQLSSTIAPKTLAHLALSTQPISAAILAEAGAISVLAPASEILPLAHDYAGQVANAPEAARETTTFVRRRGETQREADFGNVRKIVGDYLGPPR